MFWLIESIVTFFYYLITDYYYSIVYERKKHKFIIYFIQFIGSFIQMYIKYTNDIIASLIFYVLCFMPLIFFDDNIKDKLIHFISIIAIESCVEILVSSINIIFYNLIQNRNDIFLSDILHNSPIYFYYNSFIVLITMILELTYIKYLSKTLSLKHVKKVLLFCAIPVILLNLVSSLIYITILNKKLFSILSIFSFLLTIFIIVFVFQGLKIYLKEERTDKYNQQLKKIYNLQIIQMKYIDDYYKNIRKRNHDFQNHCAVLSKIFEERSDYAKEYIESMLSYYQETDEILKTQIRKGT